MLGASQSHRAHPQHQAARAAALDPATLSTPIQQQANSSAAAPHCYQGAMHLQGGIVSSRALAVSSNEASEEASNEASNEEAASSELDDCSSSGEDDDRRPRKRSTARKQTTSSKVAASSTGGSAALGSNQRAFWTSTEDAIVIAAVKQYGQSWVKVKSALDRAGGPPRSARCIYQRYSRIAAYANQQRNDTATANAAASASSSSSMALSQQQPRGKIQQTFAALPPNLPWNPRQREAWSTEEESKLASIRKRHSNSTDAFAAFLEAFPTTTRTPAAVRKKVLHVGPPNKSTGVGKDNGNSTLTAAGGGASHTSSGSSTHTAPPKSGLGRPRKTPLARTVGASSTLPVPARQARVLAEKLPTRLDDGVMIPISPQRSGQDTTMATRNGQGAREEGFRDSQLQTANVFALDRQVNDYTITRQENGFLVENLPPGHQLHILTPMQYRLVAPQHGASLPPTSTSASRLHPSSSK